LARDGDRERWAPVGSLHVGDDVVDPRGRLVRHRELHHRRMSILRDERGILRIEVGADALDAFCPAHLVGECPDEAAKRRLIHRLARRPYDDDVGDRSARGCREGGLSHVVRALGLRVVRRFALGGEGAA
jgi:hypothetical protein